MRILYVSTGLDYGGAERQLVDLALLIKAKGCKVSVLSMLPPKAFDDMLQEAGIPVYSLGMARGVPDPRAIVKTVSLLKKLNPDIVHSHMVHANLLMRLVRVLYRFPVMISTAHSMNEGHRWREIAYRLTDPLCDLTTHVCTDGLVRYEAIGAIPEGKGRYQPNGVDTNIYKPNPKARERLRCLLGIDSYFVWIAVGRLEEPKDYGNMLCAFATSKVSNIPQVLLIVGNGSLMPEMIDVAEKLGIKDRVKFLGLRTDIPDLLNAADAFVMSSSLEGMPLALLEAGASGLPAVVTNVGGTSDVVIEGVTGMLVPAGDTAALATEMNKLVLTTELQRANMGEVARKHVCDTYSLEAVSKKWHEIYEELLTAQ